MDTLSREIEEGQYLVDTVVRWQYLVDTVASRMEEDLDVDLVERLKARPYQEELLQKALLGNTIVYLGTGSGKTFIAVMLVKEMRGRLVGGAKVTLLNSWRPEHVPLQSTSS